ncbi:hypothetical protein [Hymenobacter arizonensis]|uniref:Uncharacterized protein n=1 Tax=Hymenobacter arizonensis TaxID=1227077 RepID=A0A1I6B009_HYMAR|nr:hypothetical protein [Hymenobacter arizonensis]SFQ74298.1 hypothetical protein SAMN04515668_4114 [Hymenobacter arizonensis]
MNYNFLANRADIIWVLNFIFENTDLQVFDCYSELGQEVCQYISADEIAAKFDLESGGQSAVTFQMWSPRFGGAVAFRKIKLNPESCNGHTHRYSTDAWGMIQLYLGGCQNNILSNSSIGHFSEKGALAWEDIRIEKGKVNCWNWEEIAAASRSLKYHIHKIAVGKIGSSSILPGANELSKTGIGFGL